MLFCFSKCFKSYSNFETNSPWPNLLFEKSKKDLFTLKEIVPSFDLDPEVPIVSIHMCKKGVLYVVVYKEDNFVYFGFSVNGNVMGGTGKKNINISRDFVFQELMNFFEDYLSSTQQKNDKVIEAFYLSKNMVYEDFHSSKQRLETYNRVRVSLEDKLKIRLSFSGN